MVFYERPSRRSRALVIVSAVAVTALAAWTLTPIVLAGYPGAGAAVPLLRDALGGRPATGEPQLVRMPAPDPQPAVPPAPEPLHRELAMEPAAEADTDPPESQAAVISAPPPDGPASAPAVGADSKVVAETEAPAPADADTAVTAARVVPQAFAVLDAPGAQPLPANVMPWPELPAASRPSAAEDTTASIEAAAIPPLPRRRPSAAILARLVVPVPRERPYEARAEAEEPASAADLLFDRANLPN